MANKQKLTLETGFEGLLLGLVCSLKDFQLGWHLNRELAIDLKKRNDIEVIGKRKNKASLYSFYHFEEELDRLQYYLLSNKYHTEHLVVDVKQMDYFLMVRGEIPEFRRLDILRRVRALPVVQLVTEIDFNRLKSRSNLILD